MNELITITTDEQGLSVVKSARELHSFLEVKSRFNDWFKNRVAKYGFVEGQDYVTLTKNLESGGKEYDYALTLDMAKELAMVERTEKGRQARQYFIEAEKRLQQVASAQVSTEQVLLQLAQQQTQLLANQQEQLNQLRSDLDRMLHQPTPAPALPPGRSAHSRSAGQQLGLPGMPPPARPRQLPLRQLISQRVNEYCLFHGAANQETYTYLYKRLYDVYGVNVYRLLRGAGESILDSLERYGHLDRLYSLIMAELSYSE